MMDCEEIKKILPTYINHSACEEDTQIVEEHLCVCQLCRKYLADFLDSKQEDLPSEKTKEEKREQILEKRIISSEEGLFNYIILGIALLVFAFLMVLFLRR